MIKAICTSSYDPCYGFKIIKTGTVVNIQRAHGLFVSVHVLNEQGQLIATCSDHEFKQHFRIV